MITGDNEYTACDVAVRSGLVKANNLPWVILRKNALSNSFAWVLPHSDPKTFAELSKKFPCHIVVPRRLQSCRKHFPAT